MSDPVLCQITHLFTVVTQSLLNKLAAPLGKRRQLSRFRVRIGGTPFIDTPLHIGGHPEPNEMF